MKTTERPPRFSIAEIESELNESLAETTLASRRLDLLCRNNHMLTIMLAEAHAKTGHLALVVEKPKAPKGSRGLRR